jgi:hypothetical protein
MSLAGSSDRNLWAAGIAASNPARTAAGRLVAYGWNGIAWHRKAMPRVFLAGPPQLAVAASGEAWIVGHGTRRAHHKPIILYRIGGKWKRLPIAFMDGIPRTHSVLLAAACQRTSHGLLQDSILIDKPH